jgi:diguanylate cyclase (GGDEF)-like protein
VLGVVMIEVADERPAVAVPAGVAAHPVRLVEANAAAHRMLDDTTSPARRCRALLELPAFLDAVHAIVRRSTRSWRGELQLPSSGAAWLDVSVAPFSWRPGGRPALLIAHLTDITARRAAEQRLTDAALHDPLTGLPNRTLLRDRLAVALTQAERSRSSVGLMFLDLDGFKSVNDGFGHEHGDEVLATVAGRLTAAMRAGDSAARWGGDEFVVLCPSVAHPAAARALGRRLLHALREPIVVGSHAHQIDASIGIALAAPGCAVDEVVRQADLAMYQAKRAPGPRSSPATGVVVARCYPPGAAESLPAPG